MRYKPSVEEIKAVSVLAGDKRYEYTIKKVADFEELWSLADNEGWCLIKNSEDNECVPVWPAEAFAQEYCTEEWANYCPKSIELAAWLSQWTPGMDRDGRKVAVFPVRGGRAVVVEPCNLKDDLEVELGKY